jgi:hypothetical protein
MFEFCKIKKQTRYTQFYNKIIVNLNYFYLLFMNLPHVHNNNIQWHGDIMMLMFYV